LVFRFQVKIVAPFILPFRTFGMCCSFADLWNY